MCWSAREPEMRIRDAVRTVGIAERAVQRIVSAFEKGVYISKICNGHRNSYEKRDDLILRHPNE